MGAYYFPALFRLINVQPPQMEHSPRPTVQRDPCHPQQELVHSVTN